MVGWLGGFMLVCGLGGLGVLLLAVGFPCPLGLVGVRPLCVGGSSGAGGGLFLVGLRWCVVGSARLSVLWSLVACLNCCPWRGVLLVRWSAVACTGCGGVGCLLCAKPG